MAAEGEVKEGPGGLRVSEQEGVAYQSGVSRGTQLLRVWISVCKALSVLLLQCRFWKLTLLGSMEQRCFNGSSFIK